MVFYIHNLALMPSSLSSSSQSEIQQQDGYASLEASSVDSSDSMSESSDSGSDEAEFPEDPSVPIRSEGGFTQKIMPC